MIEVEFLKPDKHSGAIVMTKDTYRTKMNQMLMDENNFEIDETLDNNYIKECSVGSKLQIL